MRIWSPHLEALEEAFSLEEMELSQHSLSSEEVDENKQKSALFKEALYPAEAKIQVFTIIGAIQNFFWFQILSVKSEWNKKLSRMI